MFGLLRQVMLTGSLLLFGALPSTQNYKLRDYNFGTGGGSGSTSNYSGEFTTGELNVKSSSNTYTNNPGLLGTQQANVPNAPTLTNDDNWYNRLHIVLDNGDNPTDARFAIAISTDDFTTESFVQNDNTIGAVLGSEDYQTFAQWGGVGGEDIIGLDPATTYKVRVKAMHGNFTESGYSPEASASTSEVSISFDIDVSSTDTETAAPYTVAFGNLLADSVNDSPDYVWFDIATNAGSGANIYVLAANTGLKSSAVNYTIASTTGDLSSLDEGVGAQSASATQSSGGPLQTQNPYDGSSDTVGIVDSQFRVMYSTTAPIVSGRASFLLKAKSSQVTPSANDYNEVFTVIAAAAF